MLMVTQLETKEINKVSDSELRKMANDSNGLLRDNEHVIEMIVMMIKKLIDKLYKYLSKKYDKRRD